MYRFSSKIGWRIDILTEPKRAPEEMVGSVRNKLNPKWTCARPKTKINHTKKRNYIRYVKCENAQTAIPYLTHAARISTYRKKLRAPVAIQTWNWRDGL